MSSTLWRGFEGDGYCCLSVPNKLSHELDNEQIVFFPTKVGRVAARDGDFRRAHFRPSKAHSARKIPHPSPLPKGEGRTGLRENKVGSFT